MSILVKLGNLILDLLKFFTWVPPLLARVTVGWVFVESGWGKLHHLDKVTDFFTSLGIPSPGFMAHFVANTEFIGGLLLLAGLATRIVSVPLFIIMFVAIKTARHDDLHGFSDLIGFPEYLYQVLLVWLAVAGPGALSLDKIFAWKFRKEG